MRFGPHAPDLLPGGGVERVKPPGEIAEHQQVASLERRGDDRRADRAVGLERPLQASGVGAHRVHDAAGATDEDLIADHRRLGKRRDVPFETERPFQLQARDLLDCQPGANAGNEARVVSLGTPSIPRGHRHVAERHAAIGAVRLRPRTGLAAGLAEVGRNGLALVTPQREGNRHHGAEVERPHDARRGHRPQGGLRGRTAVRVVVAGGATRLVERFTGWRSRCTLRRCGRGKHRECEDARQTACARSAVHCSVHRHVRSLVQRVLMPPVFRASTARLPVSSLSSVAGDDSPEDIAP